MIRRRLKNAAKSFLARYSLELRRVTPMEAICRDFRVTPEFSHVLLDLIHRRGSDFYFAQLGANDGVQADPIRSYILQCNLAGVLVEPVPDVCARLLESYSGVENLSFVNAAITDGERRLVLYRPRTDIAGLPDWARGTITTNRKQLIEVSYQGFTIEDDMIEAVEVEGIPITEFVSSLPKKIDLLQIDCEGYDQRLIRAFPFHLQKPSLINFEHALIPPPEYENLLRFLLGFGYRFISGGYDTCAVRNS